MSSGGASGSSTLFPLPDSVLGILNSAFISEQDYGLEYERLSNTDFLFKATNYLQGFFKNISELKSLDKFCDITLKGGQSPNDTRKQHNQMISGIKAHKIVLASASPYFRAMLTSGYRDETFNEITLANINQDILDQIVDFIYKARILITNKNVMDLLPAAKMLQMDDIVNACCIYLYINMDSTNCLGIEEFARDYGCMDLCGKAQRYIDDHFADIVHGEEFLSLNGKQLCNLLLKDELKVRCETIVFKAVVNWVRHDPEQRRPCLDQIFEHVRCHYLPAKFIQDQMETCDLISKGKCRDFFRKIYDDLVSHRPCPYQNRKPNIPFGIYIVGGYQKQSIALVEYFRKSNLTWDQCADMRHPRSGIACVTVALYVYAIGGRNSSLSGNIDCAEVECFDPFLNAWSTVASMNVPRSRCSAGVIDGNIYVCGGANSSQIHASVERYSIHDNRWEYVACMCIPRMGLGCAVVNRLLYSIGGFDGQSRLNQTECYNPDTNSWYFVASMNTPRSGAGVCSHNNCIYMIGGYTTDLQLNTAERYDCLANQWSFISNMNSPRSAHACVMMYDRICILGGYTGKEFLATCEIYVPQSDTWIEGPKMTSERSGHGAAVSVEMA